MDSELRDAHELTSTDNQTLMQMAVGNQIRKLRTSRSMTVADLSRASAVSLSMISKIENGRVAPSLALMRRIADGLGTSITSLLAQYEEHRNVCYVPSGRGLEIERRGTRSGHHYRLLGHGVRAEVSVEPYLITLNTTSDTFAWFQHSGVEFIYVLEGQMAYRHADAVYSLNPGDSLFFDPQSIHGPERLIEVPVRFLAVIAYSNTS